MNERNYATLRVVSLAGFLLSLVTATVAVAEKPGLILGKNPVSSYCRAIIEQDAAIREAEAHFPEWSSSERQWQKRREWLDARSEEINSPVTDELGVPHLEWFVHAEENNWTRRCDALASGVVLVEKEHLSEIDSESIEEAERTLWDEYVWRLAYAPDRFFDPNMYGAPNCRGVYVDEYAFVGCKLRSFTAETDPDIFVVAQIGGATVVVPYDGEARDRVAGLSELGSRRGMEGQSVRLGAYVGDLPLVDYTEIRAELE